MDGLTNYNQFIANHKPQLLLSGVPEHFWQTLCKKLQDQIFDSGLSFALVRIDYENTDRNPYDPLWGVVSTTNIQPSDSNHIYLIDHAWTFKPNTVKSSLRNIPGLLERLCNLLQVPNDCPVNEKIEKVSTNVWKLANTYSIGGNVSVEESVPIWYIMDELGSGVMHSDTPNVRAIPFYYMPEQMSYTLLFPIVDIPNGEIVTRNYVEGEYGDPMQREAMLIPWRHYDNFYEPFTQEEPSSNYFIEGHIVETLPNLEMLENTQSATERKLKVYSEYRYINDYLTSTDFEIVNNENDADILWYTKHFKNYKAFSEESPHKFINQFPFEYVITVKDLLAIISRRGNQKVSMLNSLEGQPPWLPITFNLKTELPKLASYYMERKKAGLDNHWICKPYNLARGLDTYITDNLDFLCRLPLTGPKIAQKYLEKPVLFERPDKGLVKFDIRYVILLTSVEPTEVFIYSNFFLRFSNKAFAMNNFEDYEQHFTVMNYNDDAPLFRMMAHEFREAWNKQYADFEWSHVEQKIFDMFRELFTLATKTPPPCSIAKSPQSRALYAADIMLSWQNGNEKSIQPKLLEVNWMPDCQRACVYYPNFYNDVFSTMFLNKPTGTCIKIL